ncbi:uncharacterized protein LOC129617845 [Condylostylus longicornis]|uniref:uncharacterized protein LOC129617845 n=1 Tax=Condylostylus longicornis TaxID=2530218 RepID=UPI00244E4CF0|nr:uncharacterized protein LOC129617845 [Condylostylus longicornis]
MSSTQSTTTETMTPREKVAAEQRTLGNSNHLMASSIQHPTSSPLSRDHRTSSVFSSSQAFNNHQYSSSGYMTSMPRYETPSIMGHNPSGSYPHHGTVSSIMTNNRLLPRGSTVTHRSSMGGYTPSGTVRHGSQQWHGTQSQYMGQHAIVSQSSMIGEAHVISERIVEHEVRVPKKVVREDIVEKLIVVPEKVVHEEVVEDIQMVREKIIEVAKPIIQERIVEVPEIEYIERIVEVPEVILQEKIKEVRVDDAVVVEWYFPLEESFPHDVDFSRFHVSTFKSELSRFRRLSLRRKLSKLRKLNTVKSHTRR